MPKLTKREHLIGWASLVVLIAIFLHWQKVGTGADSPQLDGWTTGISGWGGAFLLSAAGEYLVVRRLEYRIWAPPFGDTRFAAALAGIGLVLVIYCLTTLGNYHGVDSSPAYGIWIALAAGVVEVIALIDEARRPLPD